TRSENTPSTVSASAPDRRCGLPLPSAIHWLPQPRSLALRSQHAFRTLLPGSSIDLRGASFNQLSPGHRHPRPREMLIALCPCLCLTVLCPLASLGVVSTYMQLIDVCRSASQAIPLHASLPLSPAQCRLRSVLSGRL